MDNNYIKEIIATPIETGTIIAILDNKISSKRKSEEYFSSRWLEDTETAESFWNELIKYISRYFTIEVIEKKYPKINRVRRELTICERKRV